MFSHKNDAGSRAPRAQNLVLAVVVALESKGVW